MRARALLALLSLTLLAGALPAGAQAAPSSISIGYGDTSFESREASVRELWFEKAVAAEGKIARINLRWASVAPAHPGEGFDASDPASPAYRWQTLDAAVRSAAAHGMQVLLTVYEAPAWAEGKNPPPGGQPGTWRPQPALFAAFGKALARRYDGDYPDPLSPGATLPRVAYYEVWNEPNQDYYFAPQWDGGRLVGPGIYRNLVNAFYAAVKGVDPVAKVLAGSMSPFGDPPGGSRTPPVVFLRTMLCLRGGNLKPARCRHPAHLDILSDHPITGSPPLEPARSPLDVEPVDVPRLTRILRRAESTHRVLPAGRRPLWATEFWYLSDPPVPGTVPIGKQARWYEQVLYLLWKEGVSAFFIQPFRDPPLRPAPEYALASGIYFNDGEPKPSMTAMRFPFVAERRGRSSVRVWGIAPQPGAVRVEVLRGGRWRSLVKLRAAGPTHPFGAVVRLGSKAKLRAVIGDQRSLIWEQR